MSLQSFYFEEIETTIGKIFILENKKGICCLLPYKDSRVNKIKKNLNPTRGLNYHKNIIKNLNNYYHWKLKNASNSIIEYSYFINWKNEKLLNELFHNPNFILEFNKIKALNNLNCTVLYFN